MSTIQVGGQLQPGTVDTPLDARARVATLSAIASIALPYIGMPFFVTETGRLYVVKSLKSRQKPKTPRLTNTRNFPGPGRRCRANPRRSRPRITSMRSTR